MSPAGLIGELSLRTNCNEFGGLMIFLILAILLRVDAESLRVESRNYPQHLVAAVNGQTRL